MRTGDDEGKDWIIGQDETGRDGSYELCRYRAGAAAGTMSCVSSVICSSPAAAADDDENDDDDDVSC